MLDKECKVSDIDFIGILEITIIHFIKYLTEISQVDQQSR